jgi:poly-beta-1,6-N-acetyl-D-glucosamine synthase
MRASAPTLTAEVGAGHRRRFPGHRRGQPRRGRPTLCDRPIVALIPARNEPGIGGTVRSLRAQTRPPDLILVVANNCTDGGRTVYDAEEAGAVVVRLADNQHLKAGAINHGLDALQVYYPDGESAVLVMDADTVLDADWVRCAERALRHTDAVSGAYHGRDGAGLLGLAQRTEFAQAAHRAGQHPLRVAVLSGTATMFRMSALRRVRDGRAAGVLDGPASYRHTPVADTNCGGPRTAVWYSITSIVEDFELTLCLRALGLAVVAPPGLRVTTDVMGSWAGLWRQRIRWQEGTLRALSRFGLGVTWRLWAAQVWIYLVALTPPLFAGFLLWAATRGGGVVWDPRWLAVTAAVGAAEGWQARSGGWRCVLFAGLVAPMWLVGFFRIVVYYWAAGRALRRPRLIWHEN